MRERTVVLTSPQLAGLTFFVLAFGLGAKVLGDLGSMPYLVAVAAMFFTVPTWIYIGVIAGLSSWIATGFNGRWRDPAQTTRFRVTTSTTDSAIQVRLIEEKLKEATWSSRYVESATRLIRDVPFDDDVALIDALVDAERERDAAVKRHERAERVKRAVAALNGRVHAASSRGGRTWIEIVRRDDVLSLRLVEEPAVFRGGRWRPTASKKEALSDVSLRGEDEEIERALSEARRRLDDARARQQERYVVAARAARLAGERLPRTPTVAGSGVVRIGGLAVSVALLIWLTRAMFGPWDTKGSPTVMEEYGGGVVLLWVILALVVLGFAMATLQWILDVTFGNAGAGERPTRSRDA